MSVASGAPWLVREPGNDYPDRLSAPARSSGAMHVLTAVGSLLVGFLLAAGAVAGQRAAAEQDARKDELIALVSARQERTERLGAQLAELRGTVDAANAAATGNLPVLGARLAQAEAAAGLTAIRGPGLRVTFADAGEHCTGSRRELCRVLDADLQLAVNTLFAAGAEAIAVNGERVMATTAIRSAGQAVLVNYRVLTSPYVLDAVGNPDTLARELAASSFGRDFTYYRDEYGLGFQSQAVSALELPAYAGSVRLRVATTGDRR
jgi:uncharacterized protein YlxW (UPF0749 family)